MFSGLKNTIFLLLLATNSRDYLLAGKARMSKEMRSFQVGERWFNLKKDDSTGTGCNIYFDRDNAWLKGTTKPLLI